ncbi:MAG: Rid family detoxifying hydrolase [Gammaproteobacteria bacterium]|jgi:reactive intermediate/imine deaminase|nr:Rid family detoxifying hydrolase [Gammaproteobacteria bacterium]
MNRTAIHTPAAPAAIGVYSQAIRHNDTVYISGQLPLDPTTGELAAGGIEAEIRQVFSNLQTIAAAAGTDLNKALKVTVFLTDLGHFALVNEVMAQFCSEPYPARAAVQVAALPKGVAVEADAVVAI